MRIVPTIDTVRVAKKVVYNDMSAALAEKVANRNPIIETFEENGNIARTYKFYNKSYTYYEDAKRIKWRKL